MMRNVFVPFCTDEKPGYCPGTAGTDSGNETLTAEAIVVIRRQMTQASQ